jgi:tetratricopeptide (TPR) repeat protein
MTDPFPRPWYLFMSRFLNRSISAVAGMVGLSIVGGAVPASAEADRTTRLELPTANTFSGNYLAALVAGLSTDTAAAAQYYAESLKFDPHSADLAERAFVTMLAEGNMTEALRLSQTVSRKNPGNGIVQLILAANAFHDGQFAAARSALHRGTGKAGTDLTASLLTAWAWLGAGNPKKAAETIEKMPDDPATRPFRNLHAGLIAKLADKSDEALSSIKSAYDNDHNAVLTADLYARTLYAMGQKDEAKAVYLELAKILPRHPLIRDALERIDAGKPLEDRIKDEKSGAAEVLFGLGSAVTRDGDELSSLIYLRLAVWLMPDHAPALLAIGETYDRMKQLESAIAAYDKVPKDSALRVSADIQRALDLEQLGRSDEAISLLKQTTTRTSEPSESLIALGNIYRSRKQFAEAAEAYSAALKSVPTTGPGLWSLYYSRGIALERLKRWPEAETDFRKALELSPEQPLVLNYLGYSWIEQGSNLDEAFRMLRRAVEQRPTDGYIVDSLGWAYYRLGQYDNALQLMERAVSLKAADPTVNDHLGDVYWRLGRKLEAQFQWNHARDLGAEPEDLPKILEKIEKGLPDEPQKSGG